jgi:predicted nucleic acid binding AN1-type Zn finger protein
LEELGIEPSTLKFEKLPESENYISSLTIEQARQGLAKSFAVNPEQIEILIKG